jgi:hypothetical protein
VIPQHPVEFRQKKVSTVRRAVRSFLAVVYAKPDDWIFPSTKMKGRTPLSATMMAADKIRPAAVKVGILLELVSNSASTISATAS